jgi:hypothetical protein
MDILKIYLSSGSVPVIPQMLNFAECAYDPKTLKIICWYRNEVTPFQLKGTKCLLHKTGVCDHTDFISKIINAIQKLSLKWLRFTQTLYLPMLSYIPLLPPYLSY